MDAALFGAIKKVVEHYEGGADLENNKSATIDVSQYSSPVEITPSSGKDAMKKTTVNLTNIPSGGSGTSLDETMVEGIEDAYIAIVFMDENYVSLKIENITTYDFSNVRHIYVPTEYGSDLLDIPQTAVFTYEDRTLYIYDDSFDYQIELYVGSSTATRQFSILSLLLKRDNY